MLFTNTAALVVTILRNKPKVRNTALRYASKDCNDETLE